MPSLPTKVANRIASGLKRFQTILDSSRARDANESDTVVIVMDLLHEIFGYDKYAEITSEFAIRGTYCDLAVKIDGALAVLIEVKAIGLELKDQHVKQAVDYAANQGCEWVVLTNAVHWRAYKISFTKPIEQELIVDINLCQLNPRRDDDIELVWLLCKEGWQKARLGEYAEQKQALSRFTIGALLLTDPVLGVVRRELRRVSPEAKIEETQIKDVMVQEVLRREVLEGDKAEAARRLVTRAANRLIRATKSADSSGSDTPAEPSKP